MFLAAPGNSASGIPLGFKDASSVLQDNIRTPPRPQAAERWNLDSGTREVARSRSSARRANTDKVVFLDASRVRLVNLPTPRAAMRATIARQAQLRTGVWAVSVARAALPEKRGTPALPAAQESSAAERTHQICARTALQDSINRRTPPASACPVCRGKPSPRRATKSAQTAQWDTCLPKRACLSASDARRGVSLA